MNDYRFHDRARRIVSDCDPWLLGRLRTGCKRLILSMIPPLCWQQWCSIRRRTLKSHCSRWV